jgi:hypothetical protein
MREASSPESSPALPAQPPRWIGRKEDWVIQEAVKIPRLPGEKVWAPERPDDLCRRLKRVAAENYGLHLSVWTIKKWLPRRPRKKPSE